MSPLLGGNLPEFTKPIAINTLPREDYKTPYRPSMGKIKVLKKRIVNYILSDCNSGATIIKKSNIRLLVDENTKNILIQAIGGGRMCLTNINEGIVQSIANEEDIDYTVKIDI